MLIMNFPENRLVMLLLRGHLGQNFNLGVQRLELFFQGCYSLALWGGLT